MISYNATLVPPSGVSAFSQGSLFNPDDNLLHRNNIPLRLWCTDVTEEGMGVGSDEGRLLSDLEQNGGTIYDINVTFSEPLLLTHILTSGFSNGYVNNFTLAHSLEEAGSFLPYNCSSEAREFVVPNIDTVFEISPPLAARRISFNILDGLVTPSGQLCWHLTLLGCTLPEGEVCCCCIQRNGHGFGKIPHISRLVVLYPLCYIFIVFFFGVAVAY